MKKQNSTTVQKKKPAFAVWFRRHKATVIILLAAALFVVILLGSNSMKMVQVYRQWAELGEKISEEEARGQQLDEQLQGIGTKAFIEKNARQYFRLYYPDEKMVIPVEENTAGDDEAAAQSEKQ